MLFEAFPDSTSSSRLMVIVLLRGGGSLGAVEMFEAEPALSADSGRAAPVGVDSFGNVVGAGSPGPIAGGSDESAGRSCDGRVTITVSPASLAIPQASAENSRIVTGW